MPKNVPYPMAAVIPNWCRLIMAHATSPLTHGYTETGRGSQVTSSGLSLRVLPSSGHTGRHHSAKGGSAQFPLPSTPIHDPQDLDKSRQPPTMVAMKGRNVHREDSMPGLFLAAVTLDTKWLLPIPFSVGILHQPNTWLPLPRAGRREGVGPGGSESRDMDRQDHHPYSQSLLLDFHP